MPRIPLPNWPLVATVATWGFNFVALKLLYLEMTPAVVGLVRFVLMWIVVVGICYALKQPLQFPSGKRNLVLLQGFLSMGLYMVLFLEGMKRTSAGEGAIVLASSPVLVAVLSALLKHEKFRIGAIVGAVIALTGVAIVILGGAPAPNAAVAHERAIGDVMILMSACVWAIQAVISKPIMSELSPWSLLALGMPAAALILIPYGGPATFATDWSAINPLSWWMIAYLTVMAGIIGFAGFYAGVRKIGAPSALLYQFFVPPTAALSEWLVFGKVLQPLQFLGMAVVISGVYFANRSRSTPT